MSSHLEHPVRTYTDSSGREFHYILINKNSPTLVVHFTAFFGDWGDRKEYKQNYQGYFHRYRMLKDQSFSTLFLCDQYGATKNGTYYTGEEGDFFVEKAMEEIIKQSLHELNLSPSSLITIGSSMGAFGALKFGLQFNSKAIVAISPHIDLDTSARLQGRELHVSKILKDGNCYSEENKAITRQITSRLQNLSPSEKLPRLFIHSCKDDHGVHYEQVIPFLNLWKSNNGKYDFDERISGGHGSDYCTREVILDVIEKLASNLPINVSMYQKSKKFLPKVEGGIFKILVKRLKRIVKKALLREV